MVVLLDSGAADILVKENWRSKTSGVSRLRLRDGQQQEVDGFVGTRREGRTRVWELANGEA